MSKISDSQQRVQIVGRRDDSTGQMWQADLRLLTAEEYNSLMASGQARKILDHAPPLTHDLLHNRLGHVGHHILTELCTHFGLSPLARPLQCKHCVFRKSTHTSLPPVSQNRATQVLERVSADFAICSEISLGRAPVGWAPVAAFLINEFSGYVHMYPQKSKNAEATLHNFDNSRRGLHTLTGFL